MPTNSAKDLAARLAFLRTAEQLKDTLRSAYTAKGRTESVADHSWRLTLMVMTFADYLPELNLLKLLKTCVLHDLGEAIHGDIPAPQQDRATSKAAEERTDFVSIIDCLPEHLRSEFLELWDDYENTRTPEAIAAKAFDKLETILQHNQGLNPTSFDYAFNLTYGKEQTAKLPITSLLRDVLDEATLAHINNAAKSG